KQLESDKYYLQIGLFDRKDVLARELTTLNWAYPYAIETSDSMQSPKYKLLVGPVNEGESNALLLRFKRYGYNDAFIRKEG
ncbi:MAG: SPOR domain-containing protein, partial [Spirochaetaceae bacterium]|nr:SPOR domain-containing protein [Spirochaetaceae bacterium]